MSGILHNKSRVIDLIITPEGRRQLASGNMRIESATFSDAGVFYDKRAISDDFDATMRPSVEACGLPQDVVALESDDSGFLTAFPISGSFDISNGRLFNNVLKNGKRFKPLSTKNFWNSARTILSSSLDNFSKQRQLRTHDKNFDDTFFDFSHSGFRDSDGSTLKFFVKKASISINDFQKLFEDPALSNVQNFKFLPPINRIDADGLPIQSAAGVVPTFLSKYDSLSGISALKIEDVNEMLRQVVKNDSRNLIDIHFDSTSRENNLFMQVFELSNELLMKLDVIDFGNFIMKTSVGNVSRHVFFIGKVRIDDRGSPSFFHIFTVVFS